jgi:HAD domain in Swiss Army Knife RNA repair proteins
MKPEKIIFLDIDGVLNTDKHLIKFGRDHIDQKLISILRSIVLQTKAEIVLSSTWRLDNYAKNLVKKALDNKDLKFICCTPHIESTTKKRTNRSEEIKKWLSGHPSVEKYAVLDDRDDAGYGIEKNFFQTDPRVGLTYEIAEKVAEHLNN